MLTYAGPLLLRSWSTMIGPSPTSIALQPPRPPHIHAEIPILQMGFGPRFSTGIGFGSGGLTSVPCLPSVL